MKWMLDFNEHYAEVCIQDNDWLLVKTDLRVIQSIGKQCSDTNAIRSEPSK